MTTEANDGGVAFREMRKTTSTPTDPTGKKEDQLALLTTGTKANLRKEEEEKLQVGETESDNEGEDNSEDDEYWENFTREMQGIQNVRREERKAKQAGEEALRAEEEARRAEEESRKEQVEVLKAAKYGQTERVGMLLGRNPNLVYAKSTGGLTPLDYANKYGQSETARIIGAFLE